MVGGWVRALGCRFTGLGLGLLGWYGSGLSKWPPGASPGGCSPRARAILLIMVRLRCRGETEAPWAGELL